MLFQKIQSIALQNQYEDKTHSSQVGKVEIHTIKDTVLKNCFSKVRHGQFHGGQFYSSISAFGHCQGE